MLCCFPRRSYKGNAKNNSMECHKMVVSMSVGQAVNGKQLVLASSWTNAAAEIRTLRVH